MQAGEMQHSEEWRISGLEEVPTEKVAPWTPENIRNTYLLMYCFSVRQKKEVLTIFH